MLNNQITVNHYIHAYEMQCKFEPFSPMWVLWGEVEDFYYRKCWF